MSITLLDDNTISKIAAGEIIENPASVVKELVENSIDAGSSQIIVELKGAPCDYLRVTDNGCGISQQDIDIAFLRHSTSKLNQIDDLKNIHTLGFRGEALASIAHVAKLKVMTKSQEDSAGTMVEVEDGKIIKKKHLGMPRGTSFFIHQLFYNLPVRKKFLKSDTAEANAILEIMQKMALGNPTISMEYLRDGKNLLNTSATENYKNHIYTVLGKEIAVNLIESNFKSQSYRIKLFISNNKLFRSTRTHQYIYINGRYISNLLISKTIEKLYHSLIPLNRYPVFIAYIDIDPILVDVNIHPKKQEVKFSKENNLLAIISEMVEEVLYPNRSIPEITPIEKPKDYTVFELYGQEDMPIIEQNVQQLEMVNQIEHSENIAEEIQEYHTMAEDKQDFSLPKVQNKPVDQIINNVQEGQDPIDEAETNEIIDEKLLHAHILGTLFKTYIFMENPQAEKVFIIDQHAAHERVLYEKFKKAYMSQSIHSQILLKPEIIELSPMEFNKVEEHKEKFIQLGFEIEEFGENILLLRSVPIMFGLPTYVDVIRDIISSLDHTLTSGYEADLYKIMKKACKRAVKSGDNLSSEEISALVDSLIHCDNPYTCPHGRPTIIDIKKSTIAKLFLRE